MASRADIREEIDRLRAHVAAARDLLHAGGAVGRRLDFLAQEFGREANTLTAKANDASVSRIGLELKTVVETMARAGTERRIAAGRHDRRSGAERRGLSW